MLQHTKTMCLCSNTLNFYDNWMQDTTPINIIIFNRIVREKIKLPLPIPSFIFPCSAAPLLPAPSGRCRPAARGRLGAPSGSCRPVPSWLRARLERRAADSRPRERAKGSGARREGNYVIGRGNLVFLRTFFIKKDYINRCSVQHPIVIKV